MVGTQLIEKTRELVPDLPVILASGYGELPEAAIHNVIKLAKPFGQAQLAAAIRKVEMEQQALPNADRAPVVVAAE
jgi:DNA-binding NtrC family response regulator